MNNGREDIDKAIRKKDDNANKQYVDENVALTFPQRVSSKHEESDGVKCDPCSGNAFARRT
jgi:hypothetical protein